jgi:type IV conjugative transfer system coupling protein TraD
LQWFYDQNKDYILNPFDARGAKWNLLGEIEHVPQIKSLARAFIPQGSGEGRVWNEAARIAFSAMLEKLQLQNNNLSNLQIAENILRQDIDSVANLVKNTDAQSIIDLTSPKTAASVMFVLATYLSSLKLYNNEAAKSFSIKRWLQNEQNDSILFITSQSYLDAELAPLQTAWFEIAISGILSQNNSTKKTWVIIDELASINAIPSLHQGLSRARSYGGCLVLGMQNIAQLEEVYGQKVAQDISSECNTRCIFRSNDPNSAKWLADNIGQAETTEYKEGVSYGAHAIRDGVNVNRVDTVKNLVLPSEILNLKDLHLLLKMTNYSVVRTQVEYQNRPELNQPFIPLKQSDPINKEDDDDFDITKEKTWKFNNNKM